MDARGCPLLVRVWPCDVNSVRVELKLEAYFQSPKKSGGGECEVRSRDAEQGLYAVWFLSEEAKNQVKAREPHYITIEGRNLDISILPNSEVDAVGPEGNPLANRTGPVAEASPAWNTVSPQNELEWKPGGKRAGDLDHLTRKIFLSVSATLNTDLFTREERDQVVTLFPTIKIDLCSSHIGIEKVMGDYDDIQKLHSHFEKVLGNSHRHRSAFLPLKRQNSSGEMDVEMESPKEESKNDFEALSNMSNMEVPSAIFEYFNQVCKEDVLEIEQKCNYKLTWNDRGDGLTSVRFVSLGAPNSIEKAQQKFVNAFQKITSVLKQERIPFTDRLHFAKAQELLSTQYKCVLVKTEGNELILRGPGREISAAKNAIEEIKTKHSEKNPKTNSPESGIEVHAETFKFLEPILAKDIKAINQKYDTEIETKPSVNSGNLVIFFKPKKYTRPYEVPKAYNCFFEVYQKLTVEPRERKISWNLLEVQKKLLNQFFSQLCTENPRVILQNKGEGQLIFRGLPEEICKAEKHIKTFLDSAVEQPPESVKSSVPASSNGAMPGRPFEQNSDHRMPLSQAKHPSQEKSDLKAKEVEQEEQCSICMDKFNQKEVLPKCKHEFCRECIREAMKHKPACPVCNEFYGKIEGNQPPGQMTVTKSRHQLPGYEGSGTITIAYTISDGIQTNNHPHPGKRFFGTSRIAYLPDNEEGREVLKLLRQAFDQKLIFTVGQSRTSGISDVVTWNDIHHKTSTYGGPQGFGYPDPHYLKRVKEELKAKGIE